MPDRMLAAVFKGHGELALEERPVPTVRLPDDVLLEVEAAGVCGTDLHICEDPPGHPATPGIILGHEYAGCVREVGKAVTLVAPGDRVVVAPALACGVCRYCRLGRPNQCEHGDAIGIFRDGGFARYSVVPERGVFKISPNLPADEAVYAELLSCVMGGTGKVRVQPGDSAVILGGGPAGLMFLLFLKAAGASPVILVERGGFRGERAKHLGADLVINALQEVVEPKVMEATGLGADVVVDAVGTLFAEAMHLVAKGGKILLFGMNARAAATVCQNDLTRDEIAVLGTYVGVNTFPLVIKALESGR